MVPTAVWTKGWKQMLRDALISYHVCCDGATNLRTRSRLVQYYEYSGEPGCFPLHWKLDRFHDDAQWPPQHEAANRTCLLAATYCYDQGNRNTRQPRMSQPNGLPLHVGPVLAPSKEGIHSEAPPTRPPQKRVFKLAVVILAIVALEYLRINVSHISHLPFAWITSTTSFQAISDNIIWKSCGENYGDNVQCANVTVPLDYHNPGDGRTYSVAMARLLASDKANR